MTPEKKLRDWVEQGVLNVLAPTEEHRLAISERQEYEAATPEERKGHKDLAYFIHARHPERSSISVQTRNRLNRAGERATILWERIAAGMPLRTASVLLRECESVWKGMTAKDRRGQSFDDVMKKRLVEYDSHGHIRVGKDGKIYRATSPTLRATRVAKGEVSARGTSSSSRTVTLTQHKAIVRDAIAAWMAARAPKDDPRAGLWTAECMREIEVVLTSFTSRFGAAKPRRDDLFSACDLLNIPRPRWGKPADQKRAWKNRRSVLKSTHPDTLGHEGGLDAYRGINDAYNIIIAYNDSLNLNPNVNEKPGESDVPSSS